MQDANDIDRAGAVDPLTPRSGSLSAACRGCLLHAASLALGYSAGNVVHDNYLAAHPMEVTFCDETGTTVPPAHVLVTDERTGKPVAVCPSGSHDRIEPGKVTVWPAVFLHNNTGWPRPK